MDFHAIRCLLFTPANRPQDFKKAKASGADGLIIDLEDSIPLAEKDNARDTAIRFFSDSQKEKDFIYCLRINSIRTTAGLKDLLALINLDPLPDALILPKIESPIEIKILDTLLSPKSVPYIALVETSEGLFHAKGIAQSSENMKALFFGGGDLAADLGAELSWESMLQARSTLVQAAATAGLALLDIPYLNLKDPNDARLIEETKRVKALGYTGKTAIHPKHIAPIIQTFNPSNEEINQAKRIVEIYENAGGKVCEIDGKMIDVPIYRSAKRILTLAKKSSKE